MRRSAEWYEWRTASLGPTLILCFSSGMGCVHDLSIFADSAAGTDSGRTGSDGGGPTGVGNFGASCAKTPPVLREDDSPQLDFSTSASAAGNWAFGSIGSDARSFRCFEMNRQLAPTVSLWTGSSTEPNVSRNTSMSSVTIGTGTWPAGAVAFHPGTGTVRASIRWRAPRSGRAAIRGSFTGIDRNRTTTTVSVLHRGAMVWSGNINVSGGGNIATIPTDLNLDVNAGELIDFVVNDGGNGMSNDNTQAAINIMLP